MSTAKSKGVYVDVRAAGKKRWEGTTEAERTDAASSAARSRWDRMTDADRKAFGAKLAAARAAKRKSGK